MLVTELRLCLCSGSYFVKPWHLGLLFVKTRLSFGSSRHFLLELVWMTLRLLRIESLMSWKLTAAMTLARRCSCFLKLSLSWGLASQLRCHAGSKMLYFAICYYFIGADFVTTGCCWMVLELIFILCSCWLIFLRIWQTFSTLFYLLSSSLFYFLFCPLVFTLSSSLFVFRSCLRCSAAFGLGSLSFGLPLRSSWKGMLAGSRSWN